MKMYQIRYCYLDKNNEIEKRKDGTEIVYADVVFAKTNKGAIKELQKQQRFIVMPEILEIEIIGGTE